MGGAAKYRNGSDRWLDTSHNNKDNKESVKREKGGGGVLGDFRKKYILQSWNKKNSCIELIVLVLTPQKNEYQNSIMVVGLEKTLAQTGDRPETSTEDRPNRTHKVHHFKLAMCYSVYFLNYWHKLSLLQWTSWRKPGCAIHVNSPARNITHSYMYIANGVVKQEKRNRFSLWCFQILVHFWCTVPAFTLVSMLDPRLQKSDIGWHYFNLHFIFLKYTFNFCETCGGHNFFRLCCCIAWGRILGKKNKIS